uniref:Rab11 family-interacting protein 4 isoform X1 n=1 Tax=Petromyzon marinus TaxID=7757 RepID=A0AAJ7TS87_PETMA|nr:rab11 family-interacting protein 4 isoform X1 [Petromyzon marinus]XP_032823256.1 rab11 family-interacting protein 4 isoform X1 [Petromyzon marinus]
MEGSGAVSGAFSSDLVVSLEAAPQVIDGGHQHEDKVGRGDFGSPLLMKSQDLQNVFELGLGRRFDSFISTNENPSEYLGLDFDGFAATTNQQSAELSVEQLVSGKYDADLLGLDLDNVMPSKSAPSQNPDNFWGLISQKDSDSMFGPKDSDSTFSPKDSDSTFSPNGPDPWVMSTNAELSAVSLEQASHDLLGLSLIESAEVASDFSVLAGTQPSLGLEFDFLPHDESVTDAPPFHEFGTGGGQARPENAMDLSGEDLTVVSQLSELTNTDLPAMSAFTASDDLLSSSSLGLDDELEMAPGSPDRSATRPPSDLGFDILPLDGAAAAEGKAHAGLEFGESNRNNNNSSGGSTGEVEPKEDSRDAIACRATSSDLLGLSNEVVMQNNLDDEPTNTGLHTMPVAALSDDALLSKLPVSDDFFDAILTQSSPLPGIDLVSTLPDEGEVEEFPFPDVEWKNDDGLVEIATLEGSSGYEIIDGDELECVGNELMNDGFAMQSAASVMNDDMPLGSGLDLNASSDGPLVEPSPFWALGFDGGLHGGEAAQEPPSADAEQPEARAVVPAADTEGGDGGEGIAGRAGWDEAPVPSVAPAGKANVNDDEDDDEESTAAASTAVDAASGNWPTRSDADWDESPHANPLDGSTSFSVDRDTAPRDDDAPDGTPPPPDADDVEAAEEEVEVGDDDVAGSHSAADSSKGKAPNESVNSELTIAGWALWESTDNTNDGASLLTSGFGPEFSDVMPAPPGWSFSSDTDGTPLPGQLTPIEEDDGDDEEEEAVETEDGDGSVTDVARSRHAPGESGEAPTEGNANGGPLHGGPAAGLLAAEVLSSVVEPDRAMGVTPGQCRESPNMDIAPCDAESAELLPLPQEEDRASQELSFPIEELVEEAVEEVEVVEEEEEEEEDRKNDGNEVAQASVSEEETVSRGDSEAEPGDLAWVSANGAGPQAGPVEGRPLCALPSSGPADPEPPFPGSDEAEEDEEGDDEDDEEGEDDVAEADGSEEVSDASGEGLACAMETGATSSPEPAGVGGDDAALSSSGLGELELSSLGAISPVAAGSTSGVSSGEDRESGFSSPCLPERWKGTPQRSVSHAGPSEEEHFEDYGEGDESDFVSEPHSERQGGAFLDAPAGSVPTSPSERSQRRWLGLFPPSPGLALYCSQCSRRVDLLRQLDARLRHLEAHSPNRRISTNAFARQLLNHSSLSSAAGSTEDLYTESLDLGGPDIGEKVSILEKKVLELENDTVANCDLQSKLKQENLHLVHRIHELEEQLKDTEVRGEERLEEDARRHREQTTRLAREKNAQMETLANRLLLVEEENEAFQTTVPRLKTQIEKLEEEKTRLEERLEDLVLRVKDEMDLSKKLSDKMKRDRHEFQKEREATQELIEDLRRELEHLQLFRLEMERGGRGRSASSGLQEYNTRTREAELEQEVRRVKMENRKLKESNDELNGQIISLSLQEAKNLFSAATKSHSLAAEIDSASRDELMVAFKELEDINAHLRQYMDKIILAILDHNPSILEIKS